MSKNIIKIDKTKFIEIIDELARLGEDSYLIADYKIEDALDQATIPEEEIDNMTLEEMKEATRKLKEVLKPTKEPKEECKHKRVTGSVRTNTGCCLDCGEVFPKIDKEKVIKEMSEIIRGSKKLEPKSKIPEKLLYGTTPTSCKGPQAGTNETLRMKLNEILDYLKEKEDNETNKKWVRLSSETNDPTTNA